MQWVSIGFAAVKAAITIVKFVEKQKGSGKGPEKLELAANLLSDEEIGILDSSGVVVNPSSDLTDARINLLNAIVRYLNALARK